jgi:hypothetical protein
MLCGISPVGTAADCVEIMAATVENIARLGGEVLPGLRERGQQSTRSGRWLRICERAVMNSW